MTTNRARRLRLRQPVRREGAERYLFLTLVSFAATVLATRGFLELTGYPRIGGGELHIAHALWHQGYSYKGVFDQSGNDYYNSYTNNFTGQYGGSWSCSLTKSWKKSLAFSLQAWCGSGTYGEK
jgi:hypothetical protein